MMSARAVPGHNRPFISSCIANNFVIDKCVFQTHNFDMYALNHVVIKTLQSTASSNVDKAASIGRSLY